MLTQGLMIAMDNQDAAGKFLKLPLGWRNSESRKVEDPTGQQPFLLAGKTLPALVGLGMRDTAVQAVLKRGTGDMPSLSR